MKHLITVLLLMTLLSLFATSSAFSEEQSIAGDAVTGAFPEPSRVGDPLANLPSNVHMISRFGERPAFSPDGKKIAFVGKSYGDIFEYDLGARTIRNLTAHVPNIGFLRVHYMKDGSYLLLGPATMAATREETRASHIGLWWMDAKAEGQVIPLDKIVYEGIAVSRDSNLIAWANISPNVGKRPYGLDAKSSLSVGEVRVANGVPALVNARKLVTRNWDDCQIEAQDFYDNDERLTATCYVFNKSRSPGAKLVSETRIYTINVSDGSMHQIPTPRELFSEVEGIFPDGRLTTVECGNDSYKGLDICLLETKTKRPKYTRLTHVQDYGGYRFSNPVVSPDSRYLAFQFGLASAEAGVGRGILIMDLRPDR